MIATNGNTKIIDENWIKGEMKKTKSQTRLIILSLMTGIKMGTKDILEYIDYGRENANHQFAASSVSSRVGQLVKKRFGKLVHMYIENRKMYFQLDPIAIPIGLDNLESLTKISNYTLKNVIEEIPELEGIMETIKEEKRELYRQQLEVGGRINQVLNPDYSTSQKSKRIKENIPDEEESTNENIDQKSSLFDLINDVKNIIISQVSKDIEEKINEHMGLKKTDLNMNLKCSGEIKITFGFSK